MTNPYYYQYVLGVSGVDDIYMYGGASREVYQGVVLRERGRNQSRYIITPLISTLQTVPNE